jgi:aspartyl-tRNA(Asn)/glutamyl-tRNA(Gln) amidotransferase subunit B
MHQDTGKTLFDARRQQSSIDLNRAGTGLMEIVSEPDMRSASSWPDEHSNTQMLTFARSPEEAGEYIRTLQQVLRFVGSSDGNMENVSAFFRPLACFS